MKKMRDEADNWAANKTISRHALLVAHMKGADYMKCPIREKRAATNRVESTKRDLFLSFFALGLRAMCVRIDACVRVRVKANALVNPFNGILASHAFLLALSFFLLFSLLPCFDNVVSHALTEFVCMFTWVSLFAFAAFFSAFSHPFQWQSSPGIQNCWIGAHTRGSILKKEENSWIRSLCYVKMIFKQKLLSIDCFWIELYAHTHRSAYNCSVACAPHSRRNENVC